MLQGAGTGQTRSRVRPRRSPQIHPILTQFYLTRPETAHALPRPMLFGVAWAFGGAKGEPCGDRRASCQASLNVVLALSRLATAGRERGNSVWTAKRYAALYTV